MTHGLSPDSAATLDRLMREHGLAAPDLAERVRALALDAIAIAAEPAPEPLPIGASRVGGAPDMPADWRWPMSVELKAAHMGFLAQIDLAELPPLPGDPLPRAGLLSFFLDIDEPAYAIRNHVIFTPADAPLIRHAPPEGTERAPFGPRDALFPACSMRFNVVPSLDLGRPSTRRTLQDALDAADVEAFSLMEALNRLAPQETHLLGAPDDVLGEPALEAYLTATGRDVLRFKTHLTSETADARLQEAEASGDARRIAHAEAIRAALDDWIPNRDAHLAEASKWRLLFKLGSIRGAEMSWWDAGFLQFMIHEDALARRDFSAVYCDLASS